MSLVTRLLVISRPTAGNAIELLITAGIFAEVGEPKRHRLSVQNYLKLLD